MATVTTLNIALPQRPVRPLRILLSAYACEPERGSEPGIGWQWATRLAACGHEVVVLTRANNAGVIAAAMHAKPLPNLHFAYFDLPPWARFWKRGGRGVQLYYLLWQWATLPLARRLHRQWQFDVVHHLTFGVFRHPSALALLDVPFVFGPVGGGESAPRSLRRGLPFAARVRESLRDLANAYARVDPLLNWMFSRTTKILCKTTETRDCVPTRFQSQCQVLLEIGTESLPTESSPTLSLPASPSRPRNSANNTRSDALNVLYVGRLVYLKGLHFALPAFAQLVRELPESRLTIVGSGPQEDALRKLSVELNIEQSIEWVPWLPRAEVLATYPKHDVFLFPSLHDSSGNAVLEAMGCGLPVVCLRRGGPATIVDAFSGICVDADKPAMAIQQLSGALQLLARNPALRAHLSLGAWARANSYFSWRNQIERMNKVYSELQQPAAVQTALRVAQ